MTDTYSARVDFKSTIEFAQLAGAEGVSSLDEDRYKEMLNLLVAADQQDRKENQIIHYQPASARAALVHRSNARIIGAGGGNGSSKTDTILAEISALASGVFPASIAADLRPKFRGPVRVRIVIESLTTTIEVILSKLQWWKWSGVGEMGSTKGHWGWIPKMCLKDGEWDKSWREKLRTLTIWCRNPDDPDKILGESIFQFCSHDQDPSDFASGDFHHVMMDEPPRLAIWRENEARTMRVKGRLYLAMTWPDDPSIPVDWIHDEIYEKGIPGPQKAKDIDWIELWTTENKNLDQESVSTQMNAWSEETKRVRIYGQPIRFSNRIHPLFTDTNQWWSFPAGRVIIPEEATAHAEGALIGPALIGPEVSGPVCPDTGSTDIIRFCHVQDLAPSDRWPTLFLLDPHPRKPHMGLWVQITPDDDVHVIEELELDADPVDLRDFIHHVESAHSLRIADRYIDPNMGRSPASAIRGITWQDEFTSVGLHFALADDGDVGRARINEYLRPDNRTMRPRLLISSRCTKTIFQMKRYVWDNYRRQDEKDLKQIPKSKSDDYPTLLKYLMNTSPCFDALHMGAPVVRRGRAIEARSRARV